MKLWNISKNRFYENAWLGFSHCSKIFWKLFLAFIGLFSQILGQVHLNLRCPFYVRNFSKFWVKVSIYIWVLSQLIGWIFVPWILMITQEIPHIFRVQWHKNRQNRPILTILNLRSKSARFYAHPFIYLIESGNYKWKF